MGHISYLILHCSATREGKDFKVADVDRWHRQRGWRCIGYHYVIELDGTVRKGRREGFTGAHCKGYNSRSLGICYIGGLSADDHPKDTRTPAQLQAMQDLLRFLLRKYPDALVAGHNQLAPKACPSFDVPRWAASIGIPPANIYRCR